MPNDEPPERWAITPLARALADFDYLLDSSHANFFRSVETIGGIYSEQRRLAVLCQRLFIITFVGAFLIHLGPLPANAKVSAVGAEFSLASIPQQIIAFATATVYAFFLTQFTSLIIIQQMIERILRKEGVESWQFFSARFDATSLWIAPLALKTIGYKSPKRHLVLLALIGITSLTAMLFHSVIVLVSLWTATMAAYSTNFWFLKTVATMGMFVGVASFATFICSLVIRMPFKFHKRLD